jgi:hypothetical protein
VLTKRRKTVNEDDVQQKELQDTRHQQHPITDNHDPDEHDYIFNKNKINNNIPANRGSLIDHYFFFYFQIFFNTYSSAIIAKAFLIFQFMVI